MATWDGFEGKMSKGGEGGGGGFLRLVDDGDHALVAFVGEPVWHEIVWSGEAYEEYSLEQHGPRATAKPSRRAAVAVYDFAESRCKVLDMAKSAQGAALAAVRKFSPEKWAFEISRKGAKGSTDTTYGVLPDHELTPAELAAISAAARPDIHALLGLTPPDAPVGGAVDEEVPF